MIKISKDCLSFISSVQQDVSKLCTNDYYNQAYCEAETAYWLELAQHIYNRRGDKNIVNSLDIGCAYGTLAVFLKQLFNTDVYCIDFVPYYMSEALKDQFNLHFAINNIEIDQFPWDVKFDIILFTEVLEHFNFHPVPTLEKIQGLLSDDGLLYLSTPNAKHWGKVTKYYDSLDKIPSPALYNGSSLADDHVYVYEEAELLDVIGQAGLCLAENFTNEKQIQLVLKKKASGSLQECYDTLKKEYDALANSKLGKLQTAIWKWQNKSR